MSIKASTEIEKWEGGRAEGEKEKISGIVQEDDCNDQRVKDSMYTMVFLFKIMVVALLMNSIKGKRK